MNAAVGGSVSEGRFKPRAPGPEEQLMNSRLCTNRLFPFMDRLYLTGSGALRKSGFLDPSGHGSCAWRKRLAGQIPSFRNIPGAILGGAAGGVALVVKGNGAATWTCRQLLRSLSQAREAMVREMEPNPDPAAAYRAAHLRKLMVLTHWKGASPGCDEFCRVRAVETLAPGLWLTASFLDGSERRFRPEKIRVATIDEERRANELLASGQPGATPLPAAPPL